MAKSKKQTNVSDQYQGNAQDQTAAEPAAKAKKVTEVVTVEMADGEMVDFAGKRQLVKSDLADGTSVRFDFRNGQVRIVPVDIGGLTSKFALHGLKQKVGDECAGVEDVEDMVLGVDELLDRLAKGDFNSTRAAGDGLSGTSVLLRAIMELKGSSVEKVKAWLKPKTPKEKAALRLDPALKPIIERIEAEKAKKGSNVDTGALLAEIE